MPAAPALPPARSLRRLVAVLVGILVLYVATLAGYVRYRFQPAAEALRSETATLVELYNAMVQRSNALAAALSSTADLVRRGELLRPDELLRLRRELVRRTNTPLVNLTSIAPLLQRRVTGADAGAARLENRLVEVLDLLQLGRAADARERLALAQQLYSDVVRQQGDAQRAGLDAQRQNAALLDDLLASMVRFGALWAFIGLGLLALTVLVLRRRLADPLGALDAGLARVARGDLQALVPVRLDDEMGRLAGQFNEMTRVLRERAEQQGRFAAAGQLLADVAHEVNNPLMAIQALAEGHLAESAIPASVRHDVELIRRQAGRAGKLVSGLLRFVREPRSKVGPIDVNAVARQAVDLVSYQFGVEQIALEYRLDTALPPVVGDAARLEQVFVNLVSNAVQAMRDVQPPRRLVVASRAQDGVVQVAVTDSGPGVAPAIAPRLFLPFASTKGAQGTGLGLYISRQIVRELGGDLVHEPVAAGGARFVVALRPAEVVASAPLPPPLPVAPPAPVLHDRGPLEGLRILFVDDEDVVRRPVIRFLRKRGAIVYEATNGAEALVEFGVRELDVAIVDVRMPIMDGAELYQRLAAATPDVAERIVFLSGDISFAERDGLDIPRDRVLLKPVDLRSIEEMVLQVAQRRAGEALGS